MSQQTFKEALAEWTDIDWAQFELAVAIGLMHSEDLPVKAKHVFWSDHPVGNALSDMLMSLVRAGVLEYRDEPDHQFRWNPDFVGTWEGAAG